VTIAAPLLGLAVVLVLGPQLAWAHAVLVKSSPAARAAVTRAPARVELWFNERLEPRFSELAVRDRDGQPANRGDARVGPDDPRLLSVAVPALAPGVYTVRYRVLSVDGHVVESEFRFTVRE
jgi:copper resistance protein C